MCRVKLNPHQLTGEVMAPKAMNWIVLLTHIPDHQMFGSSSCNQVRSRRVAGHTVQSPYLGPENGCCSRGTAEIKQRQGASLVAHYYLRSGCPHCLIRPLGELCQRRDRGRRRLHVPKAHSKVLATTEQPRLNILVPVQAPDLLCVGRQFHELR